MIFNYYKIFKLLEFNAHHGHLKAAAGLQQGLFLVGHRSNVFFYNLYWTISCIAIAVGFVCRLSYNQGNFLFVATNPLTSDFIRSLCMNSNQNYVVSRWLMGFLGNRKMLLRNKGYSVNARIREKFASNDNVFCWNSRKKFPEGVFVFETSHATLAIKEGFRLWIPTVSCLDSNISRYWADHILYKIPCNDETLRGQIFFHKLFTNTIFTGKFLNIRFFRYKSLGFIETFLIKKFHLGILPRNKKLNLRKCRKLHIKNRKKSLSVMGTTWLKFILKISLWLVIQGSF
jgi:ribosomal protein S2